MAYNVEYVFYNASTEICSFPPERVKFLIKKDRLRYDEYQKTLEYAKALGLNLARLAYEIH